LQELLYAEHKHKVLVVLQAMDTGGKDGTIRHVFEGVNPQGVKVANFKVPTPEELAHDYLWWVHKQVPAHLGAAGGDRAGLRNASATGADGGLQAPSADQLQGLWPADLLRLRWQTGGGPRETGGLPGAPGTAVRRAADAVDGTPGSGYARYWPAGGITPPGRGGNEGCWGWCPFYEEEVAVEGLRARLVAGTEEARRALSEWIVPVLIDPEARTARELRPQVMVDARMNKRNLGTRNTGVPGPVSGESERRVLRAPADGIFQGLKRIGDAVAAGEAVARVDGEPVRRGVRDYCFTISDKAPAVGGGVLEAVLHLEEGHFAERRFSK